ncbi:hypothetical protein QTO34_013589 [Cnephaeus nilssonii]|uniref:Uncharacterized protein n=1 Tax=Cnephaeus nilssonii TaxID=3371016 RepID=A0AA40I9H3_CNENI|nr:hypothetical protein QTO34_013589 [Eptesicus nilssonii]
MQERGEPGPTLYPLSQTGFGKKVNFLMCILPQLKSSQDRLRDETRQVSSEMGAKQKEWDSLQRGRVWCLTPPRPAQPGKLTSLQPQRFRSGSLTVKLLSGAELCSHPGVYNP